jgi:anti-sigma28 factor (negative regulator of flagellin synthesis)
MKIDRSSTPASVTAIAAHAPRPRLLAPEGEEPSSAPAPRRDRVEISATARELAAALEPARAEKVAQAQQRIADGTYDRPEVRFALARRLLGSGDV